MANKSQNRIIINSTPFETRVAVVTKGRLQRIFLESEETRPLVGNIYKGKVTRVLPGMNAAFINIGLDKAGFMHASDLVADDEDIEVDDRADQSEAGSIAQLVKQGQELLVQIVKPPRGTKGPRVTGQISLPGRNMVLVPDSRSIGISRKVRMADERNRLRKLVQKNRRQDVGYIVRTAAEGKSADEIAADIQYLHRLWDSVQRKNEKLNAPALVFQDLGISLRCIRDMLLPDVDEVWVDDPPEFERVRGYVEQVIPGRLEDVRRFTRPEPIFKGFGVEKDLTSALDRRVDLPSKGYLIVDETEALTTIDVNTGSFVGKSNLEQTVLATNREAAIEIAHQLRLRNLSGIIVLDFIDMVGRENRQEIFKLFRESVRDDPARTNITKVSELGLIEMTRQRIGPSLSASLTQSCSCCGGTGHVLKTQTVLGQLYRATSIECMQHPNHKIEVRLHPDLGEQIWENEMGWLQELELSFGNRIALSFNRSLPPDQFEVRSLGTIA